MRIREALTFDDVLLEPGYSEILPRHVSLETDLTSTLQLSIPFLSSAMDTVTESAMAEAMAMAGGAGVIHKNMTPEDQAAEVRKVTDRHIGAAVGVGLDTERRADLLIDAGVTFLVIDTAHGHSKGVIDTLKTLRRKYQFFPIVVGNVATERGAADLCNEGASAIKVGIGPGSICTTRVVSGCGVPQLTAITDAVRACKPHGIPVIADGGIKTSGDIVKALAAGANVVMIGSLFAGTEESPGFVEVGGDGRAYKSYRGMGSLGAMTQGSKDRYGQSGVDDKKLVPEGIEGKVPFKGKVADILHQLVGGLRSGLGYVGAANIFELHDKASFVRISSAGLRESHVHDVIQTKKAPNY